MLSGNIKVQFIANPVTFSTKTDFIWKLVIRKINYVIINNLTSIKLACFIPK